VLPHLGGVPHAGELEVDPGVGGLDAADDVGGALRDLGLGRAELGAQAQDALLAGLAQGEPVGRLAEAAVEVGVVAGELLDRTGVGAEFGRGLLPRQAGGAEVGGPLEAVEFFGGGGHHGSTGGGGLPIGD
jgi:hypothetical protein